MRAKTLGQHGGQDVRFFRIGQRAENIDVIDIFLEQKLFVRGIANQHYRLVELLGNYTGAPRIVFDDLDVFEPLNQTIAMIGIPWYNVLGNHDINLDAKHDHHSDETFEQMFGPSYYSFDYGPAHFLVVDNIEWSGVEAKYRGGLGPEQLEFIRTILQPTTAKPKDMSKRLWRVWLPKLNDLQKR